MRANTGQRRIEAASHQLHDRPRLLAVPPRSSRSAKEKLFLAIMVASLSVFAVAFVTQVLAPALDTLTSTPAADANTAGW